jgi:signal transduction histidine kinase
MAEVSVADTGIGIAPEDQEAVFEEFRQVGTADKKAEGTGLGLALSRKFIELHGGRIWVKSQIGGGLHVQLHAAAVTLSAAHRHGACGSRLFEELKQISPRVDARLRVEPRRAA